MDPRITRFLRRHHVLTLSTCSERGSWTAHCFYAFMPDNQALVFTTDPETRHGREMLQNPNVSGGIMLETKVIGKIRGIQLTGRAFPISVVTRAKAGAPSLNTVLPDDPPHPPASSPALAPLTGEGERSVETTYNLQPAKALVRKLSPPISSPVLSSWGSVR